jgi:dihydrofolate synthase / folylpolyglutamate synthase
VPPEDLQTLAFELSGKRYPVFQTPAEAWDVVRRSAHADDLICITGSFFIAAEMRKVIGV